MQSGRFSKRNWFHLKRLHRESSCGQKFNAVTVGVNVVEFWAFNY